MCTQCNGRGVLKTGIGAIVPCGLCNAWERKNRQSTPDVLGSAVAVGYGAEEEHLFRQWFDSVQDVNPKFLKKKDYVLAKKLYEKLNMRVPHSILEGAT